MILLVTMVFVYLLDQHIIAEAGNVLIIPNMSPSQLLNAARIATIIAEDGHNVTLAISTNDEPDIKKSAKYNLVFYKTAVSREDQLDVYKEAINMTPLNLLLGRVPNTRVEVFTQRCIGMLYDDNFVTRLSELKPDVAIVHGMVPCIIPHLVRIGVPFMDFCPVTLVHGLCGYPHRIPAPPSYVPDGLLQNEPNSFLGRLFNTLVYLVMPKLLMHMLSPIQNELYRYQEKHMLPYEDSMQLRSKASFLLVHGDFSFETTRPSLPKVVYIGGIQCDAPQPLEGELKHFLEPSNSYTGLIVFSLGGILDTETLPRHFVQTFLEVFRDMPLYRVVWKLKRVPEELKSEVPSNVKVVDWMPQQDLLGHQKTKLFITHGGIQGSFESICHGVATLGVNIFGDQMGNIQILVRKGMALSVDDYRIMTYDEVKGKIDKLLTDPRYQEKAVKAQSLYYDQPLTVSERLKFAVGYTIRHKGAHHLTSKTALDLHWFYFYSLDVYLVLITLFLVISMGSYFVLKTSLKCCTSIYQRLKKSKAD